MMQSPFLSIIIPVYNVENYIEECVQSIIDQNMLSDVFEIILINDGSIDSSACICEKLSREYQNVFFIDKENSGVSTTRNVGLENAKGEYIYFIDSDDYLRAGFFNQVIDYLKNNDVDFLGFGIHRTPQRYTKEINDELLVIKSEYISGLELMTTFNFNNGVWWYVFKREKLKRLRFIDGQLCEDGIFTAELLSKVNKSAVASNIIYNYYINENSIVTTKNNKRLEQLANDMFLSCFHFNNIISKLSKQEVYYYEAVAKLRYRQESYLFYGMVRLLKLQKDYSVFQKYIELVNKGEYKPYPIKQFDGYKSKPNKLLLIFFNNVFLLKILIWINKRFNLIKN